MLTHRATRDRTSQTAAEDLVLTTITHHADALLRTARRHSLCADDASDAYQRGLEIFLRNAERVDPDRAVSWLHTVIKHEAMAVRRSRHRLVGTEEFDGDAVEALHAPAPDERMLAFEDVTRAAEALQGLKPQEVRALWMRMQGRTYKEIAAELNWTYTKVNRCVTEGRRAFLTRYAGIESGDECRRLEPVLSAFLDGELTGDNARLLRRHLRGCGGCRATVRTMRSGQRSLQAVFPVALVVGGHDGGESALGVFVRIYEGVAHLAAKAQLAVEATGAGKVAAVAGAAAAVAGGGAVTVSAERSPAPRTETRHVAVAAPAKAAVAGVAPSRQAAVKAAPIVVRRIETRSPQRNTTTRTATEFAFETSAPPTSRQTHTAPRPPQAAGEFDLEP
jgi:RNA polymerase sigma factor (sigma-70 family)